MDGEGLNTDEWQVDWHVRRAYRQAPASAYMT